MQAQSCRPYYVWDSDMSHAQLWQLSSRWCLATNTRTFILNDPKAYREYTVPTKVNNTQCGNLTNEFGFSCKDIVLVGQCHEHAQHILILCCDLLVLFYCASAPHFTRIRKPTVSLSFLQQHAVALTRLLSVTFWHPRPSTHTQTLEFPKCNFGCCVQLQCPPHSTSTHHSSCFPLVGRL